MTPAHGSWPGGHTHRGARVAAAVGVASFAVGCNHEVYSPPARMMPLESVATLSPGETGVQLEGAGHGAILGLSGETGALRVRHGIGDHTDASAEVSVLHVEGASVASTFPYAFALRTGVKHQVRPWLAVLGGVGGGASAGGGFVSPDIGAVVAYENPYLVPFLSVRGAMSVPFATHPVDTGGPSNAIGDYVYTPPLTWIGGGAAGVRVPLGWCTPGPCDVRGSLLGGLGMTYLGYGGGESTGVVSVAGGAEVVF